MSLNPTLKYSKNGKRVIRCRKTKTGEWNFLSLSTDGFLWTCVVNKYPWTPFSAKAFHRVKVCYYNCTNLEYLK